MPDITKEELQERAQLIRTHEANCEIEHPTEDERAFRLATMKRIAKAFNYPELKQYGFGPSTLGRRPPNPPPPAPEAPPPPRKR